ncbi:unnamed protein product [Phaedon cochleariae]|uniref:Uncharacterized protein n=1 Tax=Phaedon cochleariae TaxID=80249 RepID=A0A9N9SJ40_PHACE|nr:unnamed protein product [Phaedon cochleariae]
MCVALCPQKTGNAIRALGRMATLSASRRNSANSTPNTPRPSISGSSLPRMSSLNEEDSTSSLNDSNTSFDVSNISTKDDLEKTCEEIENFMSRNNIITPSKTKAIDETKTPTTKIIRSRACSERSDSGISDCSTHPASSSCTSTPLLGKKFCINEEVEDTDEEKIFNTSTTLVLSRNNSFNGKKGDYKVLRSDSNEVEDLNLSNGKKPPSGLSLKLCDKIETFSNVSTKSKSGTASNSLKRLPIYTSRTVAGTIKKFDFSPTTPEKSIVPSTKKNSFSEKCNISENNNNNHDDSKSDKMLNGNKHVSRVDRILEKLSINDNVMCSASTTVATVRYRSPSPSILKKARAVTGKNNLDGGQEMIDSPPKFNSIKISCPQSPLVNKKDKPKSESFQKASAFWSSPKT